VKRLFDLIGTLLLLLVLSLPLLVLAALQCIRLGRPLFFRQIRAGKDGRAFSILKFRTMREGAGSDAERLTPWGQFLRSTSLDELPELWNVLKGEMSLVGPRPLPTAYLERYSPEQARRHEVRPGITGWAQVNGRNGLSWERQFELDLWYVEHRSFLLDLKILALTVLTVLRRDNIAEEGQATRSEFLGSHDQDRSVHKPTSDLSPPMPDRQAIEALILESVRLLAEDFELDALKSPTTDTALYGEGGALDSMALVNLIADVEDAVEAKFGASIALADEQAMSARKSPYRSVASLTDAVIERMPS